MASRPPSASGSPRPTPDARLFRFQCPAQANEQVAQNNSREALIEVSDRREKILYFEGEPRFEAKFIRRAVEDDKNLQVVILQRTAENKCSASRRRQRRRAAWTVFRRRATSCSLIAR